MSENGPYVEVLHQVEEAQKQALHKLKQVPACKSGCSLCCHHDQGFANEEEARALLDYIQANESMTDVPSRIAAILDEMTAAVVVEKGEAKLPNGRWPCSLLNGWTGACRVHEVRPLSCALAYSTSLRGCQKLAAGSRRPGMGWTLTREFHERLRVELLELGGRDLVDRVARITNDKGRQPIIFALGVRLAPQALQRFLDKIGRTK